MPIEFEVKDREKEKEEKEKPEKKKSEEKEEKKVEFTCLQCGKTFDSKKGLKIHQSLVHKEEKPEKKGEKEEPGKPECKPGEETETRETEGKTEKSEEEEKKEFPCPHCDKSFDSKRGLKTHKCLVHKEEKSGKEKKKTGDKKKEKSGKKKPKGPSLFSKLRSALKKLKPSLPKRTSEKGAEEKPSKPGKEETEEEPKEKTKEEALSGNRNYLETEIDELYQLVRKEEKIPVAEAAEKFNVPQEKIEEWGKILEEHHLLDLHYPAFGHPTLRMKGISKPERKEEPEKSKKAKKARGKEQRDIITR